MTGLPPRHLTLADPDPEYHQRAGHGSSPAKPSPGRMASNAEVYDAGGGKTGEVVRVAKKMIRDREYYFITDGSGRMFQPRPYGGLGIVELTQDEIADLGYAPEVDDDD